MIRYQSIRYLSEIRPPSPAVGGALLAENEMWSGYARHAGSFPCERRARFYPSGQDSTNFWRTSARRRVDGHERLRRLAADVLPHRCHRETSRGHHALSQSRGSGPTVVGEQPRGDLIGEQETGAGATIVRYH